MWSCPPDWIILGYWWVKWVRPTITGAGLVPALSQYNINKGAEHYTTLSTSKHNVKYIKCKSILLIVFPCKCSNLLQKQKGFRKRQWWGYRDCWLLSLIKINIDDWWADVVCKYWNVSTAKYQMMYDVLMFGFHKYFTFMFSNYFQAIISVRGAGSLDKENFFISCLSCWRCCLRWWYNPSYCF